MTDSIEGVYPPDQRTKECRRCGTVTRVGLLDEQGICDDCDEAEQESDRLLGFGPATEAERLLAARAALEQIDENWLLPAELRDPIAEVLYPEEVQK